MRAFDYLRLARLLLRLRAPAKPGQGPPPRTIRLLDCEMDIYEPVRPRGGAVLAVHGLTLDGGRDARLVHFARALARTGVTCFVPTLPALSDGRLDACDLETLQALVHRCAQDAGRPLGLVGFSLGASYALCVAAREAARPDLRAVLSFNAAQDLDALLRQALETLRSPQDDASRDIAIFAALVLTRSVGDRLALADLQPVIRDFLKGYCERPLEEKRRFFEAHLAGLPLVEAFETARSQGSWAPMSPKGQLHSLRLPTSLIHDRQDCLVPPSHAQALADELAQQPALRVWMTGATAHMQASRPGLGEIPAMLRALVPLVA